MAYRLGASAILAAWETGAMRRPLDRAMAVLWAAGAAVDGDPADLPIAERDRRLLAIRANTFGTRLPARVDCPACGAELEMFLDTTSLMAALPAPDKSMHNALRPLTSRDLAAVCDAAPEKLNDALRRRLTGRDITGDEAAELDSCIEQDAEATELRTRISCSECGNDWIETLDVASHVWAEVENAAHSLLAEVSELARAYGWSEQAILALSPARRLAYLAQVRQS